MIITDLMTFNVDMHTLFNKVNGYWQRRDDTPYLDYQSEFYSLILNANIWEFAKTPHGCVTLIMAQIILINAIPASYAEKYNFKQVILKILCFLCLIFVHRMTDVTIRKLLFIVKGYYKHGGTECEEIFYINLLLVTRTQEKIDMSTVLLDMLLKIIKVECTEWTNKRIMKHIAILRIYDWFIINLNEPRLSKMKQIGNILNKYFGCNTNCETEKPQTWMCLIFYLSKYPALQHVSCCLGLSVVPHDSPKPLNRNYINMQWLIINTFRKKTCVVCNQLISKQKRVSTKYGTNGKIYICNRKCLHKYKTK